MSSNSGYGAMADVTTLVKKLTQALNDVKPGVNTHNSTTQHQTDTLTQQNSESSTDLIADSNADSESELFMELTAADDQSPISNSDTHYTVKQEYFD